LIRCDVVLQGWSCNSGVLLVCSVCRLEWCCDVEVVVLRMRVLRESDDNWRNWFAAAKEMNGNPPDCVVRREDNEKTIDDDEQRSVLCCFNFHLCLMQQNL